VFPEGLAYNSVILYLATMTFERITIDPAVCTGKPCIRGLRFPVARLLGLLAAGETRDAILANYPYLEREDIDAVAAWGRFADPLECKISGTWTR
jgi:uncharacterized protein (DUF433 family)